MLFMPAAVTKQDKLQTLTRAATVSPRGKSGGFFEGIGEDKSEATDSEDKFKAAFTIVHEGPLQRLTSWGQWKERHFVLDRVGIYWYRSPAMLQGARSQLLKGEARSVFALEQLGLKVAWAANLKLSRDPGSKNQLSLSTPTKIMKLRASSAEAMEAWITAFDKLKESLATEFQASNDIQRELIRNGSQTPRRGPGHQRSHSSSSSSFLGQSMMVAGNTAIVRTRSASAMPLNKQPSKAVFGATFMIGVAEAPPPRDSEPSAVSKDHTSQRELLDVTRPESSVSASYQPLEGES